ncbi:MAG TPA: hypothetical protein VGC56_18470 [Allosphingosinicella sp.]|jgi:hypothetical protein
MGAQKSSLSFRLAKALDTGRAERRLTRERILLDLLNKRAAARQAGLTDLEEQLREQIRWALPVHGEAEARDAEPPAGHKPPRS